MKVLLTYLTTLLTLTQATVPANCVKSQTPSPDGVYADEIVSINEEVISTSTSETRFFGIRFCTDNVSGRITSLQFFLKDEGSDDLRQMP